MYYMKTAACYIRVSTDDQTEYSPDSQLKIIRDYAFKHDISLVEKYIFAEDGGKSGKNMTNRTEFMRLISLTKKKPKQAKQPAGNSYQGIDVFLLKPGLPLNTGVHAIDCHSCCIYSVPKNEPVR